MRPYRSVASYLADVRFSFALQITRVPWRSSRCCVGYTNRVVETGFADFIVGYPSDQLVAAVGFDDFEAQVLHGPDGNIPGTDSQASLRPFAGLPVAFGAPGL